MSDDGEPSGTAGAPILDIIEKQNLSNILVVVTRYFGGILLGTGGLVRAYSEATTKALDKASYINKTIGFNMTLEVGYSIVEPLKYFLIKENIKIISINYKENVEITIEIEEGKIKILQNKKEELGFKTKKTENTTKKYVEI